MSLFPFLTLGLRLGCAVRRKATALKGTSIEITWVANHFLQGGCILEGKTKNKNPIDLFSPHISLLCGRNTYIYIHFSL